MENLFKKIYMVVAALFLSVALYPTLTSAGDFWVHSPEPYDFNNGLLDDSYFLSVITHDMPNELYDNKTGKVLGGTYTIKSDIPFNVNAIYVSGWTNYSNQQAAIKITFSDGTDYFLGSNNNNLVNDGYTDVDLQNIIQIEIQVTETFAANLYEFDFFGSYKKDEYPPVQIDSIKANVNSIDVTFVKPDNAQAVDIWLNNQKIGRTEKETYTYENLEPNSEYEIMFVNYYGNDNYGAAVRETVRTQKELVGEVVDLTAKAESHKQVNLNWKNPTQSNFEHVTIYRDEITSSGILENFNFFAVVHAADDPTKLFETNGTYFIDHSVAASTKYEYLVTTTDDDGKESSGVSQTVQTLKKPNPDPPVSEIEKDENGDYLVIWTNPKEGKVIIRIDGNDYVTVDASEKSFLIPSKDMVYSLFGKPKVQVIAVDLDGDISKGGIPGPPGSTENSDGSGGSGGSGGIGVAGDLKGIEAKDILGGTMSFIKLLGPIILLGIIIFLVPYIIRVIKKSMQKNSDRKQRV